MARDTIGARRPPARRSEARARAGPLGAAGEGAGLRHRQPIRAGTGWAGGQWRGGSGREGRPCRAGGGLIAASLVGGLPRRAPAPSCDAALLP